MATNQSNGTVNGLSCVAVYCGSSKGRKPEYAQKVSELAVCLAENHINVVYGGSKFGLMGCLANGVLENGGNITGIIPQFFTEYDGHERAGEEIIVPDMHTRKKMIFEKADAFIALPGGLGTMEELTEILTWSKIGIHTKPVALLNISGYYDNFIEWIKRGIEDGFIPGDNVKDVLIVEKEPQELIKKLKSKLQ